MNILFDTNFIMSAVELKVDFINQAREEKGYARVLIPVQVIEELKKLSEDKKQKLKDREIASTALEIIEDGEVTIIDLEDEVVDRGIKNYIKKYDDIAVATLDERLRKAIGKEAKFVELNKKKGLK